MAGYSLHIGLNNSEYSVNSLIYPINDAIYMEKMASLEGFKTDFLLENNATFRNVSYKIKELAKVAEAGDFVFISFSGHGDQLPDTNHDEPDKIDEAWILYDKILRDDTLDKLWSYFKEDVRVLVISDSCFSGGIAKSNISNYDKNLLQYLELEDVNNDKIYFSISKKKIPSEFYDLILSKTDIKASVKLISSCEKNKKSKDGEFIAAFRKVWNNGEFEGNYEKFHKQLVEILSPSQMPQLANKGGSSPIFNDQKPFMIKIEK